MRDINVNELVTKELVAMKELGLSVTNKAFTIAKKEDLSEYDNMTICEIADLVRELGEL